ncbi:MAG: protoporphyrinogen oxidase [Rubellimicrobium sp.]|nr:protoporphyrinogen oxidase [Rubellimicrobium sp.]
MTILILYATTEGQTRKIARRAAAHLALGHHSVEVLEIGAAGDTDLTDYEAVILAASVHAGQYQPAFIDYATRNHAAIAARRNVFVSVSLSAASREAEDQENIAAVVAHMEKVTGWTPGAIWHVAGAFRFGEYDFLKSWAMRWLGGRRDPAAGKGEDREYTDWQRLYDDLDRFVAPA